MPKILVNVSGEQKELWVGAAHDERLSLSEWIRRRCDDGLGAGVPEAAGGSAPSVSAVARETGAAQTSRVSPEPAVKERATPAPSSSCRRFKMHHIHHSGKPCPECNYPLEGAVT